MATKTEAEPKGTPWLAEYINTKAGTNHTGYSMRILLRRLAKDGDIERGEGRYTFTGERDETVKAVLAAVKSGKADDSQKDRLDDLKKKRAAKKAAASEADAETDEEEAPRPARKRAAAKKAAPATATTKRRRPKPAPVEDVEDDDDVDLDEI